MKFNELEKNMIVRVNYSFMGNENRTEYYYVTTATYNMYGDKVVRVMELIVDHNDIHIIMDKPVQGLSHIKYLQDNAKKNDFLKLIFESKFIK